VIRDSDNELFFSAASSWEIAIKAQQTNREGGLKTMRTDVTLSATYQQVLDNVRCLSLEEQLALVADIATVLREAVRSEDEVAEAAYLAESPTFQRLVEHGLRQVREGKVKRAEALLSEL
jgi:hypothetical protein